MLALATVAALAVAIVMLLPFALLTPLKHRVKDAADASALAAADVAVGLVQGVPCDVAATVAEANGSTIADCRLDGLIATVTTRASVLGMTVSATSTAGPPADPRSF